MPGMPVETQVENKYLEFKQSSIHNYGAFAVKPIRKGARIIEYVGRQACAFACICRPPTGGLQGLETRAPCRPPTGGLQGPGPRAPCRLPTGGLQGPGPRAPSGLGPGRKSERWGRSSKINAFGSFLTPKQSFSPKKVSVKPRKPENASGKAKNV